MLPSDSDLLRMLDIRAHEPWYLWAYMDVVDMRKCVYWSRSPDPPLKETMAFRLLACAAVPKEMLPP